MANFFTNLINDFKGGVAEVKSGFSTFKKPASKPMVFPVGAGMTPKQTTTAYNKVAQVAEQAPQGGNFFADLLRSVPRTATSVYISASKKVNEPIQPTTPLARFVLGNEPVTSLGTQYKEAQESTKGYGIFSKPIAATAVFGGAILDLSPWGGGKKQLTEELIKETTEVGVKKLLTKAGVADDIIEKYAKELAETKSKSVVDEALASIEKLQNTTKLTEFSKAKGLSSTDRLIEEKAFEKISKEKENILSSYFRQNGKVVNADNFRPFFVNEGYRGINSESAQEPSSYLAKEAFTRGLKNDGEYVVFTSGQSGAGKSTALKNVPEYGELFSKSSVVLDSNLSNIDSALRKIKEAESAGKKLSFFYVYREPMDAFENGVVKRMLIDDVEMGRIVPNSVISKNAVGSWEVANKLADMKYDVQFIDNSLGFKKAVVTTREELAKKVNYPSNLKKVLDEKTKELLDNGTIVKDQYERYVGKSTSKGFNFQERGFIKSVKEELPDLATKPLGREVRVGGQYVPRSTDRLAIKARNLIQTDFKTAERIASTGTDDDAVAIGAELLKHYSDEALKASDESVKSAIYDKAGKLANDMARKLTEQGRSVQAASILGRLTPEGQLRFAAREIQKYNEEVIATRGGLFGLRKKIPELTAQQAKVINQEMKLIQSLADGTEKAMRFQKLQNQIRDLVPTPLFKKIITVWKAGLLTGVKTSGVNILANTSHTITETTKDIPAEIVDRVASLFTGKRTVAFNVKGIPQGAREGMQKGWQYLRTGFDERNIGTKLDYTRVNFGKGKLAQVLQSYTDSVFRLLGTEDQPFYYAAKLRSLYEQAKVAAINKKLRGKEAQAFIDNLIQNPTEEMIRYASHDAETAVFQNKTLLGRAARAIQQVPGGEVIVPFGRTPSAVAMQIVNYSPLGIAKTIFENVGKGRFDQRLFSQGLGRALTGTGALALGALLYSKGMMTMAKPTGEREQKLWELEGKQANSIKVGGKWRQIQILGPWGNLLLVGGYFQQEFSKGGSPTEAMLNVMGGTAQSFSQQTFLTGVSNFIDAISDPARSAANVAGSTLASVIPTIIGDIARATDTKERRTKEIYEKLQARVPGVRQKLEPQVTVLGEEKGIIGNPLEIMIDPTRPSPAKSSPVIDELKRLWDAGVQVSPTLLGDKNGYAILSPQQNTKLWERTGEILNGKLSNLIIDQRYDNFTDEKKGKTIEDFTNKSGIAARAEMVLELTQGLQGDELKAKLSELKSSKLMNEEVFNLWKDISGGQTIPTISGGKTVQDFKTKAKSAKTAASMAEVATLYVKAFGSDPWSAIQTLFTSEQLKDVRGGAVIMERMGISKSEGIKKKGGASSTDKLDHIVPLELGGSNAESNLRIVTQEEWKSYTPVENYLGRLLNGGKITESQAVQLIKDVKNKKITFNQIKNKYKL